MKEILLAQLNAAYESFERSTSSLTEEDSTFAPAPGVYTTAQQVAHTAQTIDWFMDGAFKSGGFKVDPESHGDHAVRQITSLSDARAWLTASVDKARELIASTSDDEWRTPLPAGPILGGLPRATIFNGITDHSAHHRGALTVYTRLRGKIPPSPYA